MISFVIFVLFHLQEVQNIQDHLKKLLDEAKILSENGVGKEIILLGQNVNAYQNDNYKIIKFN